MVQRRAKCLRDTSSKLEPASLGQPGPFRGSLGSDSSSSPIYTLRARTHKDGCGQHCPPSGCWAEGRWHFIPLLHSPSQGGARHPCMPGSSASQAFPRAPQTQKAVAKCHSLAVITPGRQSISALSVPVICLGRSQQ